MNSVSFPDAFPMVTEPFASPAANAIVTGAITPPKLNAAVRPAVTARRAMFLLMLIFFSSVFRLVLI